MSSGKKELTFEYLACCTKQPPIPTGYQRSTKNKVSNIKKDKDSNQNKPPVKNIPAPLTEEQKKKYGKGSRTQQMAIGCMRILLDHFKRTEMNGRKQV